ncbi:MAG: polymer-forming cytoskeletal protein [Verrucomicrobiota bacterium]
MSENEPKSLGKKFTPTPPSSEKSESAPTPLQESKVFSQEEKPQASPIFGKTTPLFAKKTPLAIVRESAVASAQIKQISTPMSPTADAPATPESSLPVIPSLPQALAPLTPATIPETSSSLSILSPKSSAPAPLSSDPSLTPKLEDTSKKPSPLKLPDNKHEKPQPVLPSASLLTNPDLENQVFIPAGTEIEGSIKTDRPLIIHGRVGGTGKGLGFIQNNALVYIGKTANVEANIQCEKLEVYGRADGEMIARKEVLLHKDGKLLGKIQTPNFHTEQGSFFKGTMEMSGEDVPSGH